MIAFKEGSLLIPQSDALKDVYERVRLPNPAYSQVKAMRGRGKRIMKTPQEYVYGCRWMDGSLAVPRMVNGELSEVIGDVRTLDRTTYPSREPVFNVIGLEPREYQAEAVESFMSAGSGVIEAPCGSGKTAIGIQAIARLQTPALVLVHTIDLLEQWKDRLQSCLSPEPVVGDSRLEILSPDDIVVETVQTLVRRPWHVRERWGKRFGFVIMDEGHHVPAETFSEVISSMPARYRLALTATPERADGLTDLLHWHFGPTIYRVDRDQLRDAGQILTPAVRMVQTGYKVDLNRTEWTRMLTDMARDNDRNDILLGSIRELVEGGHKVLVITERVNHARELAEALSGDSLRAEALTGSMSKKMREVAIQDATNGAVDVLCATKLADEGLDMPCLSAVVLAMPISKALGKVEQRVGRIMRPYEGKVAPVVVDLVDDAKPLQGLAWKRITKVYRKLGCEVKGLARVDGSKNERDGIELRRKANQIMRQKTIDFEKANGC